jgi:subtilisin family serine protease
MWRKKLAAIVLTGLAASGVPLPVQAAGPADAGLHALASTYVPTTSDAGRNTAMRQALTAAGSTPRRAARSYDGAPTAKACYGAAHTDGTDGTPLDATTFGLYYGCVTAGGWLFDVGTADSWVPAQLDAIDLLADTDGNPATGCGGFEWEVFGFYSASSAQLLAGMFSLSSCSADPVLSVVEDIQHPTATRVGLQFLNSDWGNPQTVRWLADIQAVGEAAPDDIPNTGYFTESGFTTGGAPACSTSATPSAYYYVERGGRVDVSAARPTRLFRRGRVVQFTGDAAAVQQELDRRAPGTLVYPDLRLTFADVPNDPSLSTQWNLAAVAAQEAWDVGHGSGSVRVAVIDSGVDATHADLAGKLVPGYDAAAGSALAAGNSDSVGHGTATAGLIGAATNDGNGLASLGYDTAIMPIKVSDSTGAISSASLVRGLYYAADNGARVINISLGGCMPAQPETDAVAYARSKNALVVAAAGNEAQDGNRVEYPAALPGVIAVGATAFDGTRAFYSNTGSYVDLAAPGGSADGDPGHDIPLLLTGGGVTREAGTSFAAPLVSAAAALVIAARPEATAEQVAEILVKSATDRGDAGRDDSFGAGVLNAGAAMRLAAQPGPLPSPSPTKDPAVAPSVTLGTSVINAGQRVTVNYTGSPGTTVQILSRTQPATAFSVIGSVVLDGNGQGSSSHAPQKNTRITARALDGAASPDQPLIQVRSVSSMSIKHVGVHRYTFTGRVYPAHAQRLVSLYRDDVLIAQGRCDASGVYAITKTLAVGPFSFFVRTANDTYNLGATSREVPFFVE